MILQTNLLAPPPMGVRGRALSAMRILGIDPGLTVTAYVLARTSRARLEYEHRIYMAGVHGTLHDRLVRLHFKTFSVLDDMRPDRIAVEYPSILPRRNRISIDAVQGAWHAIMLACTVWASRREHPAAIWSIHACTARKCALGNGRMKKEAVPEALRLRFHLPATPGADVADALVVALAAAKGT